MDGGARSGAREQEELHERHVFEPASELAENEGEEEEEPRTLKPLRDLRDPTAAERATDEATHLPFRSWCAECVAGRRDNAPHRRVLQDKTAVPQILMDHCFAPQDDETENCDDSARERLLLSIHPSMGRRANVPRSQCRRCRSTSAERIS